ncbi:hypothetical protein [Xenorhabdus lircayensis]|uniref:Uncharacterized protein n=1 Tax=Xenorhabdus lircayensis TaxID=2763499 RepID=A0ABS0U079_9GAMM|nr:hypothetical protein [Xenorhabdus lircayensis]MBI6547279.1 hypothetical protein [Xenorhabdus lircayensis]
MSQYGLKITNQTDGTSFIFNEKTSPACLIWTDYVSKDTPGIHKSPTDWRHFEWECQIKIPPGYQAHVYPAEFTAFHQERSGNGFRLTGFSELARFSQNGESVIIDGLSLNNVFDNWLTELIKVIAYPSTSGGKAGLKILNNSNFNNSVPPAGFGYVSHKARVYIQGRFDPASIDPRLNYGNCLMFFYNEDPECMLVHRKGYYTSCNRHDEGDRAGWYRIVVFSDIGVRERLEGKGYGLRLRNKDGVITFNSGVGVLTRPVSLDVSNRKLGDIIPTAGIRYPMLVPAWIGHHLWMEGRTAYSRDLSLTRKGEGALLIGSGKRTYWKASQWGTTNYTTKQSILILDAATYFNF